MKLTTTLGGQVYAFASLAEVLAKANEEKSGDRLAGLAAGSARERVAARLVLADLTPADLRAHPLLADAVHAVIDADLDPAAYQAWAATPFGAIREWLLAPTTTGPEMLAAARGWSSEAIAAITKLMSNLDLVHAAGKLEVIATCRTAVGHRGTLASRLQPNHPADHVPGVLASLYEGLAFGVGDAVIGINPVADTVDNTARLLEATKGAIDRWRIPTQNCVLAHLTTQIAAVEAGAPADLLFQSLGGTEATNRSFGVDAALLDRAKPLARGLYFETGQGSELSADAHHGLDQLTLEARCYGFARHWEPFLVNTVVGFIGPEYLYDGKQVARAGLEDHFMGKLHGLPMGVDVCYTNHMVADQNDMESLGVLLGAAGVNFVIAVPMGDDCMLNYQSLGYHDVATLRQTLGKRPAPAFEAWLEGLGLMQDGRLTARAGDPAVFSGVPA